MDEHKMEILRLTRYFVLPALELLRSKMREIVSSVDVAVVHAYINLMNFRIGPMTGSEGKPVPSQTVQNAIREWVDNFFNFF